jgi:MarR family transcriptional regulator for hemolysin
MADELELLRTVSKLAREISASYDAHLRALNMTSARARVLLFLLPLQNGASQAEVTSHLNVEHPTAVRILDGIEALGHIQRMPSADDRRAKVISLTEQGRDVAGKVSKLVRELSARLIQDLEPQEIEQTQGVLVHLLARTQEIRLSASESDPAGTMP